MYIYDNSRISSNTRILIYMYTYLVTRILWHIHVWIHLHKYAHIQPYHRLDSMHVYFLLGWIGDSIIITVAQLAWSDPPRPNAYNMPLGWGWVHRCSFNNSGVKSEKWLNIKLLYAHIYSFYVRNYKYIYIQPLVFFRVSQEFVFLFQTRNNKTTARLHKPFAGNSFWNSGYLAFGFLVVQRSDRGSYGLKTYSTC